MREPRCGASYYFEPEICEIVLLVGSEQGYNIRLNIHSDMLCVPAMRK